ncbi:M23 family metallopeptidase [Paenibacillus whitsoniae]|uniref:M23 family metallopeptidase n=1 Tax=Paenibacillus whitsoniae TaxID=2496558 RepID=A0A3S0A3U3_9BACL|nr:M23 family metallopeptidase [Paenibacillus whitsoniae]
MIVMHSTSRWTKVLTLSLLLSAVTPPAFSDRVASQVAAPSPSASSTQTGTNNKTKDPKTVAAERKELFDKISLVTGIPWSFLAAVDQYEKTMNTVKKRSVQLTLANIYFSEAAWSGMLNPNQLDTNPRSIAFFHGYGRDGSGDQIADKSNDLDVLAAMSEILGKNGVNQENLQTNLTNYYQNPRSVLRINQFAAIYEKLGTMDVNEHAFPLPVTADYSYRSTWGDSRGWGGHRIHEGTDLFAGYGVPVRSTCYGIVEEKGWNPYGGWRIGIRDLNNIYHYYAHLSGFQKGIQPNDIVKPGQVLGWVGSSGYGKPGTSGKFPPHLHFGLYRDNGNKEWSFDPYPSLRRWEREDQQRRKK